MQATGSTYIIPLSGFYMPGLYRNRSLPSMEPLRSLAVFQVVRDVAYCAVTRINMLGNERRSD
jgi:hypothetical protein